MNESQFGLVNYFYLARQTAKAAARLEKKKARQGEQPWGLYNASLSEYDIFFQKLLYEPMEYFLKSLKSRRDHAFAMDVMGQGGFYKEVPVDGEVAITLADCRTKEQKEEDKNHNLRLIPGSVYQGVTWRKVNQFMERNRKSMNGGFDLIVCRPASGWKVALPQHPGKDIEELLPLASISEWLIVNKLFKYLSPYGGMLVMQMTTWADWDSWTQQLRQIRGVDAENFLTQVQIRRSTEKILKLPLVPRF